MTTALSRVGADVIGLNSKSDEAVADEDLFKKAVEDLNNRLNNKDLSDMTLKLILEEINKEYNFYNFLTSKGYDANSPIIVKAKKFNDDKNSATAEFEKLRKDYAVWLSEKNTF